MRRIIKLIYRIPHDKLLHYVVGLLLFALCGQFVSVWIAFVIVFALSVIKEVYDRFFGGSVEVWDVVAAMTGALSIYLINLI